MSIVSNLLSKVFVCCWFFWGGGPSKVLYCRVYSICLKLYLYLYNAVNYMNCFSKI